MERMSACLIHLTLVNHLVICLHKSSIIYNLIIHLTHVNHLANCLYKSNINYNIIIHLTLVNHLVNCLHKFVINYSLIIHLTLVNHLVHKSGINYNLNNDPAEVKKRNGIMSISITI